MRSRIVIGTVRLRLRAAARCVRVSDTAGRPKSTSRGQPDRVATVAAALSRGDTRRVGDHPNPADQKGRFDRWRERRRPGDAAARRAEDARRRATMKRLGRVAMAVAVAASATLLVFVIAPALFAPSQSPGFGPVARGSPTGTRARSAYSATIGRPSGLAASTRSSGSPVTLRRTARRSSTSLTPTPRHTEATRRGRSASSRTSRGPSS
jgi:hypothetical protein